LDWLACCEAGLLGLTNKVAAADDRIGQIIKGRGIIFNVNFFFYNIEVLVIIYPFVVGVLV